MKLDFNDISIVPSSISLIESRSECNPYTKRGTLPLMTSPMPSVVSEDCFEDFVEQKIEVCLPRTKTPLEKRTSIKGLTYSVSLDEFIEKFVNDSDRGNDLIDSGYSQILIDVANGHMEKLVKATLKAKDLYGDRLFLIVGNVANPQSIIHFKHVDGIRLGIGSGSACTTSANAAIHYPMASLIQESRKEKDRWFGIGEGPLLIADGGFRNYADIIKALALGADYVMLGRIFAELIGSAGHWEYTDPKGNFEGIRPEITNISVRKWKQMTSRFYQYDMDQLSKSYDGLSTKKIQKEWGKQNLRTSEGISTRIKPKGTLDQWVENFVDYLTSAMSYTDSKTLDEFMSSEKIQISNSAYQRFNK